MDGNSLFFCLGEDTIYLIFVDDLVPYSDSVKEMSTLKNTCKTNIHTYLDMVALNWGGPRGGCEAGG